MALKIILSGYGRMGREVEKTALERQHKIIAHIDNEHDWMEHDRILKEADVVIDFSIPETVIPNITRCFERQLPVVVGTTGWYDKLADIRKLCNENEQSLLYASNFSIGVNIFFEVNKKLARLMNNFREYNVSIEEIHHTQKLDAPSGTAIELANDIIKFLDRKEHWVKALALADNEFEIKSVRLENVTGMHFITYDSEIDTIEIRHNTKNRKGFALGAIIAAEWIQNKKGFYSFCDMLNF